MKINLFTLITRSLIILLGLIAVYMFFLIIFGNSPSVADVLIIMVSAITIYLMQSGFHRGKFEGEMRTFRNVAINSFKRCNEDIKEIKENIKKMEQKLR